MNSKRVYLNAVLLPDASIVMFGGRDDYQGNHLLQVERYSGGNHWALDAMGDVIRDYHSTAVLLPDGRVLVAGGDTRCWDYQIYIPPNLNDPDKPRPLFATSPPLIDNATYNTQYNVEYSLAGGASVSKVVLMRPGSTTHHIDFDQRYVELDFQILIPLPGGNPVVRFTTPVGPPQPAHAGTNAAPPGWYMIFLVSSQGVPSVAGWIKLEAP